MAIRQELPAEDQRDLNALATDLEASPRVFDIGILKLPETSSFVYRVLVTTSLVTFADWVRFRQAHVHIVVRGLAISAAPCAFDYEDVCDSSIEATLRALEIDHSHGRGGTIRRILTKRDDIDLVPLPHGIRESYPSLAATRVTTGHGELRPLFNQDEWAEDAPYYKPDMRGNLIQFASWRH